MKTVICPICSGETFGIFANRPHARCNNCGSLERDRAIYMALSKLGIPHIDAFILHLSPEKCFIDLFTQSHGERYEPINLFSERHGYAKNSSKSIDLCKDLYSLPSNYWDLILHNHILADVFCTVEDVLRGFDRILKPGGTMLFTIPVFLKYATIEDLNLHLSPTERLKKFGQRNRARLFGADVIDLIKGVLDTDCFIPANSLFTQEQFETARIPWQPEIEPCSNSIFVYKKPELDTGACSLQVLSKFSTNPEKKEKKVLLIGFSVVEQKDGISKEIKAIEKSYSATYNTISFEFCGLGGHHIQTVAYLISDIIKSNENGYDIVLLDLTSSQIRASLDVLEFGFYLQTILQYITAFKISVGLLHFYRKDINYECDPLLETCSRIASDFNIPSLNLGGLIYANYSSNAINILFKDLVHTTPIGSRIYAEEILRFVKDCFPHPITHESKNAKHDVTHEQRFLARPIKDSLPGEGLEFLCIKRHGINFEYVCVNEDSTITIDLGSRYQLDGIIAVIGPRSGNIEIESESGDKNAVIAYDQYAYYERLQSFILKNKLCGCITLKQMPGTPSIKLLKGEKNTDKRIGKISHLLLSKK